MQSEQNAPLELGKPEIVYDSHDSAAFQVTKVHARNPTNNDEVDLHYVSVKYAQPGAVCIAQCKGHLLIARHWRLATHSYGWEFPRGMGEMGESSEQTANREFFEETGIQARDTQIFQVIHADTGLIRDSIAVAALTVDSIEPNATAIDGELQSLHWITPEQLDRMIAEAAITDGITIAAYLVWKLRQQSTHDCDNSGSPSTQPQPSQ
ncbi:NUDIX hydrolase [Bifidobacterium aquikefiricola]|uniref:NUDIX hydrolase n=1 Tax=Bifidobacterium aquikefiricola TaxID=3059038 RepID=A0AB39U5R7_9BIFI